MTQRILREQTEMNGTKVYSIKLVSSCQQWVRPDESRHIPDSVRVPRAAALLPRSVGRTNPAAALSLCRADTIKRMIEMCTIIHTCHRRGNNEVAIVSTCDISNKPQTRRRVTVVAFIVHILDSLYRVSKFYHCSKVNIHFYTNSENFQKNFSSLEFYRFYRWFLPHSHFLPVRIFWKLHFPSIDCGAAYRALPRQIQFVNLFQSDLRLDCNPIQQSRCLYSHATTGDVKLYWN